MIKVALIFADIQNLLEYVSDFNLAGAKIDLTEQSLIATLDTHQILVARIQYQAYVEEQLNA
jgi:hypothetical protein